MLKRDLRLFLRCLVPAAVLTVIFAVVCAAAAWSAVKGTEETYTPVKAAVVDGEDTFLSRMLVRGVAGTDYISRIMDIEVYDFDAAMDGLETGELSAVVVLPENFIGDITSGQKTAGQIFLSEGAASHGAMVAGTAGFGQLMLAAGQYGVFSGEQLIWRHGLGSDFHSDYLARTNAALLGEAMEAESRYFTEEITDYADTSMSTAAYFAMSWLALLLLLSAMFFSRLYTDDMTRPMLCRLRSAGVGNGAFLAGKLAFPFLFRLVVLVPALVWLTRLVPLEMNAPALGLAAVGAAAAAVMGAAMAMSSGHGVPVVAVVSLVGLFLCGGIVPRQMLPRELIALGSVTPFGAVQAFLAPVFGGECAPLSLVAAVVYLAASPWLICRRIRRLCVGGEAA